jgi:multiple sugar transport system permease protein
MNGNRIKTFARYLTLFAWAAICLAPVLWLLVTSFKSARLIDTGPFYLPFIDFEPSLEAWTFVLFERHENFLRSYVNSAVIALAATALTLAVAVPAVFALTRGTAKRDGLSGSWLYLTALATRLLPPFIVALPFYILGKHAGLLDSYLFLILLYAAVNLPVAMWLVLPVLGSKASDMEEAARIEGATRIQVLFDILLPLAAGGLAAIALIVFLQCWNEYVLAAMMTTDKAMTMPPFLVGQLSIKEAQVGGDGEEWPRFSAVAMLMLLPVLASTAYVQKYIGRLAALR